MMKSTNKLNRNYLLFQLKSGKNAKLPYYVMGFLRRFMPDCFCRFRLNGVLKELDGRDDRDYIMSRVDYYNTMTEVTELPPPAARTASGYWKGFRCQKVYLHDSYRWTRWFPARFRYVLKPGDNTSVPDVPSIVKSRPIHEPSDTNILLNMDRIRHFLFVKDKMRFEDKRDRILFRGDVEGKPHRIRLLEMYWNHPMCDMGDTRRDSKSPREWLKGFLTIREQLEFRFILCIEGNDVASNLKWVMSSNSVAVMPRPKFETWFMEGTLVPDYHYIEIAPDYHDLITKVDYYMRHPEETKAIIRHANEYVDRFRDSKRERLISLLVLDKYFRLTGQTSENI